MSKIYRGQNVMIIGMKLT